MGMTLVLLVFELALTWATQLQNTEVTDPSVCQGMMTESDVHGMANITKFKNDTGSYVSISHPAVIPGSAGICLDHYAYHSQGGSGELVMEENATIVQSNNSVFSAEGPLKMGAGSTVRLAQGASWFQGSFSNSATFNADVSLLSLASVNLLEFAKVFWLGSFENRGTVELDFLAAATVNPSGRLFVNHGSLLSVSVSARLTVGKSGRFIIGPNLHAKLEQRSSLVIGEGATVYLVNTMNGGMLSFGIGRYSSLTISEQCTVSFQANYTLADYTHIVYNTSGLPQGGCKAINVVSTAPTSPAQSSYFTEFQTTAAEPPSTAYLKSISNVTGSSFSIAETEASGVLFDCGHAISISPSAEVRLGYFSSQVHSGPGRFWVDTSGAYTSRVSQQGFSVFRAFGGVEVIGEISLGKRSTWMQGYDRFFQQLGACYSIVGNSNITVSDYAQVFLGGYVSVSGSGSSVEMHPFATLETGIGSLIDVIDESVEVTLHPHSLVQLDHGSRLYIIPGVVLTIKEFATFSIGNRSIVVFRNHLSVTVVMGSYSVVEVVSGVCCNKGNYTVAEYSHHVWDNSTAGCCPKPPGDCCP